MPGSRPLSVLLVSTYELGRQPFGLAWPAAWLRDAGAAVALADLSRAPLDPDAVRSADLVAFHLPMHTATRIASGIIPAVRQANPGAHLAAYGLYAPLNAAHLRALGVETIVEGEAEPALVALLGSLAEDRRERSPGAGARGAPDSARIRPAGKPHPIPDRRGLPPLDRYARIEFPGLGSRLAGYTEASRGCKHTCRHCPIVPVYGGRFRAVKREVVLADVDAQVAAGARHITFGDPDFLNGPAHARAIARELHARHPSLTWDMTAKIEHLIAHRNLLRELVSSGLVLVTSAAESVDDRVLALLAKGHTRHDIEDAIGIADGIGLALNLTFIPFTPWTTASGYGQLLDFLGAHALSECVPPVQLALRLLIPARSMLLEIPDIRAVAGPFDASALVHPWRHPDPAIDRLQEEVMNMVRRGLARGDTRAAIFSALVELAAGAAGGHGKATPRTSGSAASPGPLRRARVAIPFLTEPWYC